MIFGKVANFMLGSCNAINCFVEYNYIIVFINYYSNFKKTTHFFFATITYSVNLPLTVFTHTNFSLFANTTAPGNTFMFCMVACSGSFADHCFRPFMLIAVNVFCFVRISAEWSMRMFFSGVSTGQSHESERLRNAGCSQLVFLSSVSAFLSRR